MDKVELIKKSIIFTNKEKDKSRHIPLNFFLSLDNNNYNIIPQSIINENEKNNNIFVFNTTYKDCGIYVLYNELYDTIFAVSNGEIIIDNCENIMLYENGYIVCEEYGSYDGFEYSDNYKGEILLNNRGEIIIGYGNYYEMFLLKDGTISAIQLDGGYTKYLDNLFDNTKKYDMLFLG